LQLAIAANGFLNDQAPWKQMKLDGHENLVAADLYAVLEATRWVAVLLAPLLPELSDRMLVQLGQEPFASGPTASASSPVTNPPAWLVAQQWGQLEPGLPLIEPQPVMLRLELDSPL
jgi:methionyl-tRNA synthetase